MTSRVQKNLDEARLQDAALGPEEPVKMGKLMELLRESEQRLREDFKAQVARLREEHALEVAALKEAAASRAQW